MLTLREIGERTATARDIKAFWKQVLAALDTNEPDTPFVLLYSVSDEDDGESSSVFSNSANTSRQCYLEGALGVPPAHRCAPETIDLMAGTEGFGPVFREIMKTDKPVHLGVNSEDLPAHILDGLEWRGFGDPCRAVVVCPIHPTTGESVLGFLVMGVNPRRPYDDDYGLFMQLLSRQLATSLASVVLFEEEIQRGQKAAKLAALDRIRLSELLAARTQEVLESETKFTRMAHLSPAGLFIADSQGHVTYCNDAWYVITRVHRDSESTDRWIESIKEEDQSLIKSLWNDLVTQREPITAELRFSGTWEDRNGNKGDNWVLFSAFPEKHEDGSLKSIFGCITNISSQKWAEGFQKRKMEEAVELKRQQENFIDITSHEMRNPLSAILQCADEITTSLSEIGASGAGEMESELVKNSIDAAQTIALCALHQKRIVDDVLTMSKLDSARLIVTPVDVQPLTIVQRALKMSDGESQTAGIEIKSVVDQSFKDLRIDWVRMDPSRVLQVLINLTTNAIKFTTTEKKRTVTVTTAASLHRPSASDSPIVSYIPVRSTQRDLTEDPDWGDGEEVYLHFAVQDTGRGLNDQEKKSLFLRFSQASARTHVQYGGSGLGLFISRELTELQGGQIGVASEAGKGSTFAFYVKARRSTTPNEPNELFPQSLFRQGPETKFKLRTVSSSDKKELVGQVAQSSLVHSNGLIRAMETEWLKVLVCEDNQVNQRVLQKQLQHRGCVVHVANHGQEALDILRESRFANGRESDGTDISVVLMDLEMPVMDGLTCVRQIRKLEREGRLHPVPIIAVTANARMEQVSTALEAGMVSFSVLYSSVCRALIEQDDVVTKPFRVPDLIEQMHNLCDKLRSKAHPG